MENPLMKILIENLGLPQHIAEKKLEELLKSYGANSESIQLEELRLILADHLQTLMLEILEPTSAASFSEPLYEQ